MERFPFRSLIVFQKAKEYVVLMYEILQKFPKKEEFALCDQLRRAVFSIPSNIAEGIGRFSLKEQLHFYEYANGSINETVCQLEIAKELGYINDNDMSILEERAVEVAKLLAGLRNSAYKKLKNEGKI